MNTEIITNVTVANLGLPAPASNLVLTDRSLAELKDTYAGGGRDKNALLDYDETMAQVASRLADLKKLAKKLEREIEIHEATLAEAIGDEYGIRDVAVWRYQAGGTYVDMKALTEDMGEEIVKKYTLRRNGFRVLALK